ncbi:MAG: cysteine--tRNA ligase [Erysipelotrichaceae bacterium]
MQLYNSLTNKIEEFVPIEEGKVSMYVCGPTVYNHAHIGNARPIVVFDTLRRVFEALGYEVSMVSNYTDVDDKIINKAVEEGVKEDVISNRYIDAYEKVRERLNTLPLTYAPKVTQTMDQIIDFIQKLLDEGFAYEVDGDVYFRQSKIKDYGILSGQNIDDLLVGARIEENSKKESPLDFTLWKKTEVGIKWDSAFGEGRPGWHTECVVMINNYFHRKIDIHGGGMDLKFPHHENEIAQSKAVFNHGLANYWLHNGTLNINGDKMSKSLGNVMWAKDVIDQLGSNVTRWMLQQSHYRGPLNIEEDLIEQSKKETDKIFNALKQAYVKFGINNKEIASTYDNDLFHQFLKMLSDDLNTPNAYGVIFEVVKQINQCLRVSEVNYDLLSEKVVALEKMLDVLGIDNHRIELSQECKDIYRNWMDAKKAKNFDAADGYRNKLIELGVL